MSTLKLLLVGLLSILGSCERDDCKKKIIFHNMTSESLYVISSYEYPDTNSFKGIPSPLLNPNFTKVTPNETNEKVLSLEGKSCFELVYKDLIPSDTLMIYIFKEQVLELNLWNEVKEKNLVLQRYDLSLADLLKQNWIITYPPTENMKNIKMYPPYK